VRLDVVEKTQLASELASSPHMAMISKYKARQRDRMFKNVGTRIRCVFLINDHNGPTDCFQGVVRSVTAANKYDVLYDDYDEEKIGQAEFEIYKIKVKDQVVAKLAKVQSARFWKDVNDCNCVSGHFYHPWSKITNTFNPKEGKPEGAFAADFRCKDRLSKRHRQVSLHLMLSSMRLSALHT